MKKRKVLRKKIVGQPSGGQQKVVVQSVPAPVNPPTGGTAPVSKPVPPTNPPTGGPTPAAPAGGSIPKSVASVKTSTTTKVKWPWWKKWGLGIIIFLFIAIPPVTFFGVRAALDRAAFAHLENQDQEIVPDEEILDSDVSVGETEEKILDPDNVSFVGGEIESVPEPIQKTTMTDGSVILDSSVTEESAQIHGQMPRAIATSAKKVSGGVEIGYTFQNLPEYGDFQIIVALWNSWPGQEYSVIEKTIVASRYPGTAFVEVSQNEWSQVDSVMISARAIDSSWEASGSLHQLSEFK